MLGLLLQVARGVAFLHNSDRMDVSVIHRDIKPANVLLSKDPTTGEITAKVGDFGLSVLVYVKNHKNVSQRIQRKR